LGNSGGGPYTAVCAARIPERLHSAVIVSGGWDMRSPEIKSLPFVNRLFQTLARRAPFLLGQMLKMMAATSTGDRNRELAQLKKRVPAADYAAFEQPGRIEALGPMIREAIRQGTKGPVWDLRLYVRDFDFRVDEVRMPVTLFHGEQDANLPIALARRMACELPCARLVTYPGEAHLSTLCNHIDEIAKALVMT
jgi:pimeloyl-ACP methyl ester carboxylesterase